MKRDPDTDAPNFWAFARDYLHTYLPKARRLSPKTIQAYRISLECFLGYLAEVEHVEREHVNFDHFERPHLKAWLAWMSEQKGYAPKTIALRLSADQGVPGLLQPRRHHPRRAQPGRTSPPGPDQPPQTDRVPHPSRDPSRAGRVHRHDRQVTQEPDAAHPALRDRCPRR